MFYKIEIITNIVIILEESKLIFVWGRYVVALLLSERKTIPQTTIDRNCLFGRIT